MRNTNDKMIWQALPIAASAASWADLIHKLVKPIALVMVLLASLTTAGVAQATSGDWTGTWDSGHGDLRLIQEGERVYGDYADRGYFEGRVSQDGNRLRGTFQYVSQRSRNGYIEFQRSGNSFSGGWNWKKDGPVSASKGNWTGSLKSSARPNLKHATGQGDYWADFWSSVSRKNKGWVNVDVAATQTSDRYPVSGPQGDIRGDEWTGTFDTNYGDLRLVQVGRRVYGDYAKRGYFEGCVHNSGLTMRGTFQYNSPRRNHGFVEFRMDGDGFEGSWVWTKSGPPKRDSKINWRGARKQADTPQLSYVTGEKTHFADMWSSLSSENRKWVLGSDYYDSCDPPEVDYQGNEGW